MSGISIVTAMPSTSPAASGASVRTPNQRSKKLGRAVRAEPPPTAEAMPFHTFAEGMGPESGEPMGTSLRSHAATSSRRAG